MKGPAEQWRGRAVALGPALTVPAPATGHCQAGPPPTPTAARPPWALDAPQFGPRRVFRELLQKASAESKDISGSKQVLTADQAPERGKCPKAPSEGVRGEGEKVSRLLGTAFLHTPESRALFLPGAKSWQKRFRNVGRKTLVKGFGGRTRGGTRERRPSAPGPRQGLRASGWRLGAVTRAGWGTGEPRARCKPAPRACGPAPGESPPPNWRPASWAHESSSPPPRPERLFALAGFLLLRYPTPDSGWEAGTVRPRVKRLGGAEEAVAGRDRAPAAPAQTPGSHRRGGKPGRLATAGARRLLPASLSVSGAPPAVAIPGCSGRAASSDLG
ncbi:uncharacterized protein [Muntiacus reevesi]|uniref:uncharacterized protein n=1 Tax=Muntiacus reevesi TaxID=9886 RepID=UPI00330712CC